MVAEVFVRDCRLVFRTLRKRPVASMLAVITLASGIGATAAVFSVLNAIAFRDLAVKNAKDLVELSLTMGSSDGVGFSVPMVRALKERQDELSNLAGLV